MTKVLTYLGMIGVACGVGSLLFSFSPVLGMFFVFLIVSSVLG